MSKPVSTIGELVHDRTNPRKHNPRNLKVIVDSLQDVGFARSIVIDEDNNILAGNGVTEAAALAGMERVIEVEADGNTIIAVRRRGLTDEQKQRMKYYDNRSGELADWDTEQLYADLAAGFDFSGMFSENELDAILADLNIDEAQEVTEGDAEPPLSRGDVPDALFATDNEFDIPLLDSKRQAKFADLPMTRWGEIARTSTMRGTWHFYTDDYKFDALWDDPSNVVNSQCVNIVEPNFSTNEQMPMAVGLWAIYRKRWLARYWQQYGINVFVDLNVSAKFKAYNLLGVPRGWLAYMTRSIENMGMAELDEDYEIAKTHADADPLFVVYGGGKATKEYCKQQGWLWIAENMHVKDGRIKEIDDGAV